jgi:hypothetical protein
LIDLKNLRRVKMSIKKEWLRPRLRVLTRNGPGELLQYGKICKVELDQPVAGKRIDYYEPGEIVIESDFTLVRAINFAGILLVNAQNYPSWEETLEGLSQPFSQDETLIALNFQERVLRTNRSLPAWPCHLIEAYFDIYWPKRELESEVYNDLEEGKRAWQRIDNLSGTVDHILLCTLVNLSTSRVLARAIFSTLKVIIKQTWW